jgi:hypothetical protein
MAPNILAYENDDVELLPEFEKKGKNDGERRKASVASVSPSMPRSGKKILLLLNLMSAKRLLIRYGSSPLSDHFVNVSLLNNRIQDDPYSVCERGTCG